MSVLAQQVKQLLLDLGHVPFVQDGGLAAFSVQIEKAVFQAVAPSGVS